MNIRFQKLSFMSKITFKQWASNFFKGIWQAMCWVGRAFNPKNKTPFWRIIWATITVCIVIVTGILCYQCYSYTNEHENRWVHIQRISHNLDFVRSESKAKPGWISNHVTGEGMTKDIDWMRIASWCLAVVTSAGISIAIAEKSQFRPNTRKHMSSHPESLALPKVTAYFLLTIPGSLLKIRSSRSIPKTAIMFIMANIAP